MAPQRKRDNRENAFFNVGVQGRKTGITLEDRGVRDDNGLEPISGIFSSPEKSPPRRLGTETASESMDIQESSIPAITTSAHILRNTRTHFPPPRSRSPMKTTLGSSPRRQSSMAPRATSVPSSSPPRAISNPAVARRLDFEQDESSLQETPALSGSGQRRGKRADIYSIERSPSRQHSTSLEESMVQEELAGLELEESFAGQVGDELDMATEIFIESLIEGEVEEEVEDVEEVEELEEVEEEQESEIIPEPVRELAKRGRKRKSDVLEQLSEKEPKPAKNQRREAATTQAPEPQKKGKKTAAAPALQPRRSKRVSDVTEQEPSILDASIDESADTSAQIEQPIVAPKRRGRPPKVKPVLENVSPAPVKTAKKTTANETAKPAKVTTKSSGKETAKNASPKEPAQDQMDSAFKKPPKPTAKPRGRPAKPKADAKTDKPTNATNAEAGKPVDLYGNPLSKADIEQMSTTSVGSRFGRGRHLSVFREMDPDDVARVGRTGRHRVAPIDFWKNDRITYNTDGSMASILKAPEPEPSHRPSTYHKKTKKRALSAVEEEEIELEPWEEEEGALVGNYKDFDPSNEFTSPGLLEGTIAWAEKGISPEEVADGSFQYARIGSVGPGGFLNWGLIEMRADQMKRTKNSRKMHMVFNVQSGVVEVRVHENEFTVHKGGIWQVPRGNTYSIRNVGSGTARVFFAQARETLAEE